MEKITVLGLGYIGLPTAILFAQAGYTVCGVDINEQVVSALEGGTIHIVEPGLQEEFERALESGRLRFSTKAQPADLFVVSVQTPWKQEGDRRIAELKYVDSAAAMVGGVIRKGDLVVLESTVPPRTLRRVQQTIMRESGLGEGDFEAAHCPERVIPGRMLVELRENDRIIGGLTPHAAERAREVYARVVTGGSIRLTDDITAEMCKLVENTFRDINIAYANELSIVADRLGVDVFELVALANCHPRVNILTPGVGVGGHCIAVDPWFIHEQLPDETPLIATARRVNDRKPLWVAGRVAQELEPGASVCVLGLTYKADIDDLRESPSVELCRHLKDKGFSVFGCEPNVSQAWIEGFENLSLDRALAQCDYLVLTLTHSAFRTRKGDIAAKPHYDCVGMLD